ncbi:hypothetical protein [Streptomyces zaomyceticus]|uniref:hypothetical protein n=1 Tax=Streptomyces zaomyceticus TaxID=68286 RepID=UPI0037B4CD30
MPLPDKPTQWTVTLAPATPAAPAAAVWKAKAKRWGLTALALLAAYWLGAANPDGGTAATVPAPAYTQPVTVTVQPPLTAPTTPRRTG